MRWGAVGTKAVSTFPPNLRLGTWRALAGGLLGPEGEGLGKYMKLSVFEEQFAIWIHTILLATLRPLDIIQSLTPLTPGSSQFYSHFSLGQ